MSNMHSVTGQFKRLQSKAWGGIKLGQGPPPPLLRETLHLQSASNRLQWLGQAVRQII